MWNAILPALNDQNRPSVLVSVVWHQGSVPREQGAVMLVTEEAIVGTIGGGHLEFQAMDMARKMLSEINETSLSNAAPSLMPHCHHFVLGANLGQCCGGAVKLFFAPILPHSKWIDVAQKRYQKGLSSLLHLSPLGGHLEEDHHSGFNFQRDSLTLALPIDPPKQALWVFGAGHVGSALMNVLAPSMFQLSWWDTRAHALPQVAEHKIPLQFFDSAKDIVARAPAHCAYLVLTHEHALDFELVHAVLSRGDAVYCGLIGSHTKRARFRQRLLYRGLNAASLRMWHCPIGLPTIRGKAPETIAISVCADLVQRLEMGWPMITPDESERLTMINDN